MQDNYVNKFFSNVIIFNIVYMTSPSNKRKKVFVSETQTIIFKK